MSYRKALLAATGAVAIAVPLSFSWPSFAAQTRAPHALAVASIQQLSDAAATAVAGDTITVAAGRYTGGTIKVNGSGTAEAPIRITAASVGATELGGSTTIDLTNSTHVVVEGFVFTGEAGINVPPSAAATRITRNTFGNKSGAVLSVAADDTEVDHNTFQNKTSAGVYLQVNGPGSHDMAKNVHIHHNYFYNHQFKGANGGESIRLGLSGRQHGDARALVEYNLFEKADGDSEALSVKSSNNMIRWNTFLNSRGTLSLRHGWGTTVDGNIIIGGSSGIRFFGNNHTIINNIVQGSSGMELELGGGEIKDDTGSTTAHEAADHCVVLFNTFVSTSGDMVKLGGGKQYGPDDITVADNIIQGSGTLVTKRQGTNIKWQGNIINGGSAGAIPAGGYSTANPGLAAGPGGMLRPKAGSPVIDAATGTFNQVTTDLDGQARGGVKDVGADEVNPQTPRVPLTSADVGPKAP
jgi:hypothetical protein